MNENKAMMVVRGRAWVTAESRAQLLAEWTSSGMSARSFAQRAGVAVHRLYAWRRSARRGRQNAAAAPFVEVPREWSVSGWAAEAVTPAGVVRLASTASPVAGQLLRELNRC